MRNELPILSARSAQKAATAGGQSSSTVHRNSASQR